MNATILPTSKMPSELTEMVTDSPTFALCTTSGLVKTTNEDRVGFHKQNNTMRICIADGHWGDAAAEALVTYWLDEVGSFPETRNKAIKLTKQIEQVLYKRFGKPVMDAEKDFTPEASFIAVEIHKDLAVIVSYGDCRLMIVRDKQLIFSLPMNATWLGAFSHLGLRDRLSVDAGLLFEQHLLKVNDRLVLYTDGVDECVYEKPTISTTDLAKQLGHKDIPLSLESLLTKIAFYGAEDNASLAVYQA